MLGKGLILARLQGVKEGFKGEEDESSETNVKLEGVNPTGETSSHSLLFPSSLSVSGGSNQIAHKWRDSVAEKQQKLVFSLWSSFAHLTGCPVHPGVILPATVCLMESKAKSNGRHWIHLDQTRKKQETKDVGMSVNLLLAPLTAAHLYGQNMRTCVRTCVPTHVHWLVSVTEVLSGRLGMISSNDSMRVYVINVGTAVCL